MKHRPTILVADDDRHVRAALRVRLSEHGYRVVEVSDGLGVLRGYLSRPVDALILDHGMPNADGRAVARVVRNECDVPIIFLSGHDREDFRELAMRYPDIYFLSKPLQRDKLVSLLGSLLNRRSGPRSPGAKGGRAGRAHVPTTTEPVACPSFSWRLSHSHKSHRPPPYHPCGEKL